MALIGSSTLRPRLEPSASIACLELVRRLPLNPFAVRRHLRTYHHPKGEHPMPTKTFDVIVTGAGPAGEIAAGRLADKGGREVVIVERELVGGECSF